MYHILDSGGDYDGYIFDRDDEFHIKYGKPRPWAVVFESGDPNTDRIKRWLKTSGIEDKLASVHVVYPFIPDKIGIKNIRNGWKRVCYELEASGAKRVLVLCSSDLLKVMVPELDGALDTAHGTIFNIKLINNIIEMVPTFKEIPNHRKQWFNTDVSRFKNLVKRGPLKYKTTFSLLEIIKSRDIVIDLETTGLDSYTDNITTLGIQWAEDKRALIIGEGIEEAIENIKFAIEKGSHLWMHNAQFDLGFFDEEFRKLCIDRVHCTLIRAKVTGELSAPLKHLINVYTNSPGGYSHIVPGVPFQFDDPAYVCEDIEGTWQLMKHYRFADDLPVVRLFENCVVMAATQSLTGANLDVDALNRIEHDGKETVKKLESELTEKYGVHPGSNDLLIPVLQSRGYKLTKKTKTGKLALDEEVMKNLGLDDILEYRKAVKLDSAFVGKIKGLLRNNGTLPHRQNMMGADTGRSTMSDFNWQQASKKGPVKGLLISRFDGGFIGNVDLQGAELATGAYVSNDLKFAKAQLLDDMHSVNASKAFNIPVEQVRKPYERQETKTITFRAIYGGFPQNEMQKRVYDFLKTEYPKLFAWLESTGRLAMEDNKVTDYYGKTNNLLDILDYRGKWGVKRAGLNSPIQGLSSHIAFEITYYIWKALIPYRSLCLFGVHDSVVLDIHPDELNIVIQIVKDAFTNLWNTPISKLKLFEILPMRGELLIGRSWAAVEEANEAYNLYMPAIKCSSARI